MVRARAALDSVMQRWENGSPRPLIYDNAALARLDINLLPVAKSRKTSRRLERLLKELHQSPAGTGVRALGGPARFFIVQDQRVIC